MDSQDHSFDDKISQKAKDSLLEYLPFFRDHSVDDLVNYNPPKKKEDGTIQIGWCSYHQKIHDFFKELYDNNWIISDYLDKISWDELEDKNWIKQAGIEELRLPLTFLARAEKWAECSWKDALKIGVFKALLERLNEIKK